MDKFAAELLVRTEDHPVVRAALAHFGLVDIHPFVDGNGRTARLLINLILIKGSYFPAVILKNDRQKYYNALGKAHKGQLDDFVILVARALERTIFLYLEAIPTIASGLLTIDGRSRRNLILLKRIPQCPSQARRYPGIQVKAKLAGIQRGSVGICGRAGKTLNQ